MTLASNSEALFFCRETKNTESKASKIFAGKMIEVPSPTSKESNVLAVQSYTGLHLEPPTRDVVSLIYDKFNCLKPRKKAFDKMFPKIFLGNEKFIRK